MIRIRQIQIEVQNDTKEYLIKKIKSKLNNNIEFKKLEIVKKSIDARKKPNVYYVYEVDIEVDNEEKLMKNIKSKDIDIVIKKEYEFNKTGTITLKKRPVIVGSGPAGLYCAYLLSENGYKPLVIERGEEVDKRVEKVEEFFNNNNLDINTNIQFGEGGAGTFSDGKLNTLVKDKEKRGRKVLEVFVENGAPKEILYEYKPHIGTDILRNVVKNMRNKIISNGGEFRFNTTLTNINYKSNKLINIEVNNNEIIDTEVLVLAIGHSARDTFKMIYDKKIEMTTKPFAVGIRIEHPQKMINKSQYGNKVKMPPASYKLTYQAKDKRGVYTFCMCPGGYIVNASSEEGLLAINGMSNHQRESSSAASAVIVTINEKDFGTHPLDGIEFQRKLERKAFKEGKSKIPVQLYKDFKENKLSSELKDVKLEIKGSYNYGNINNILPRKICNDLIEGIEYFGTKIKGFNREDAVLAAVESRTSSPVRIIRNDKLQSNIEGIYPAGEGAGYAGGITSAAIDGIKIAEEIAKIYIV